MCGFVGHIDLKAGADEVLVQRAIGKLQHRGPDEEGFMAMGSACVAHRRLSIIDPKGSAQPLVSRDKRYVLVFNGEIYNYRELRQTLAASGWRFCTEGDTEVLLTAFMEWGTECLQRLNGMFAFAIWDQAEQRLFLARDRLGEKPLYYALGRGLVFASELPALLCFPWVEKGINPVSVNRFFAHQFIGGSNTIYTGIHQLCPGHYMLYQRGQLVLHRYWEPPKQISRWDNEEVEEHLEALVDDAVRLRMQADVPVGAFLSGGLDSSIIAASMCAQGGVVHTFCVGFDEPGFDERKQAAHVAQSLGTRHHDCQVALDLQGVVLRVLDQFDEPFADPSAVPTWHLCRITRNEVKVALSGDGADELFGGYRRYLARRYLSPWFRVPHLLRKRVIEPLICALPANQAYFSHSLAKKAKLAMRLAQQIEVSQGALLPQTFSLEERGRLFVPEWVEPADLDLVAELGLQSLDPVTQMMISDMQSYLPDDILVKVDRMSMAHGLEVRAPFLDHRVVELACTLPLEWKLQGRQQKYLLRRAFSERLPREVLMQSKHGFAVPLGQWFSGPLKSLFEEVVLNSPTPPMLRKDEIRRLWIQHLSKAEDHGFKLWSFLVFHHWYHKQIV